MLRLLGPQRESALRMETSKEILAVVLEAEVEPAILHGSSLESAEVQAELRRCHSLPSPGTLARKNKMYVR